MIKIEDLFLAFATGVELFREGLDEGSKYTKMVQSRAREFFANMAEFPAAQNADDKT